MRTAKHSGIPAQPAAVALAGVLMVSGCVAAGRRPARATAAEKAAAASTNTAAAYAPGVDVTEASLRGSEFAQVPDLEPIYFDYDSSSLGETALAALKKNASFIKARPELEFLVAGHCDERGTIEYNLALGQKRAKEVREYYIRVGVPGQAVATISYGKEQPVCSESSEDCWTQNRRAETRARSRTPPHENPAGAAAP